MNPITLLEKSRQYSKTASPDKLDDGQSKEKRYGYRFIDKPGKFMMIDKNELSVDHSYQRHDVYMDGIRKMAKEWSWVACGAISVAKRGDAYMVTDGQRRTLAAMLLQSIKELPCMVFDSEGVRDEAEKFLLPNRNRKPVSAFDKYRAQVMIGEETALSIQSALQKNGFELVRNPSKAFSIACIGTLEAKERGTKGVVDDVLSVFRNAPFRFPVDAYLFSALCWLRNNVEGGIHSKMFLERLSTVEIDVLQANMSRARALLGNSHAAYVITSRALLDTMNAGKRVHLKLKERA